MWVSRPHTYLLAAKIWLLEPLDCLGDSDHQGQSQLLGEKRQGWWEESPEHPFLPPCPIPWVPHPITPYLPGPTKGGAPTMGETTVAAAAARASRVCWTCWGGGWGKGPDSVLPNCPGWLTPGGQGFQSLPCVWGCQPLGLS